MNLFDYLNDKPAVALCAVDALDDSVLSKLPSLQISIGDNIDIDTAENPEGQVSVIYSRRVSATPEPLISINNSFRIICTQNDDCLLYTYTSPRDGATSRKPSSA